LALFIIEINLYSARNSTITAEKSQLFHPGIIYGIQAFFYNAGAFGCLIFYAQKNNAPRFFEVHQSEY